MLKNPPPKSNNERQRLFQLHHPGYDRRRKARKRAAGKRMLREFRFKLCKDAAERAAAMEAAMEAVVEAVVEAPRPVLMLPAPVQDPVLIELNALRASVASAPAREPLTVPVSRRE